MSRFERLRWSLLPPDDGEAMPIATKFGDDDLAAAAEEEEDLDMAWAGEDDEDDEDDDALCRPPRRSAPWLLS